MKLGDSWKSTPGDCPRRPPSDVRYRVLAGRMPEVPLSPLALERATTRARPGPRPLEDQFMPYPRRRPRGDVRPLTLDVGGDVSRCAWWTSPAPAPRGRSGGLKAHTSRLLMVSAIGLMPLAAQTLGSQLPGRVQTVANVTPDGQANPSSAPVHLPEVTQTPDSVSAFGNAPYQGSPTQAQAAPGAVGIVPDPSGTGYWVFTANGEGLIIRYFIIFLVF
jgi:hypothetical protein